MFVLWDDTLSLSSTSHHQLPVLANDTYFDLRSLPLKFLITSLRCISSWRLWSLKLPICYGLRTHADTGPVEATCKNKFSFLTSGRRVRWSSLPHIYMTMTRVVPLLVWLLLLMRRMLARSHQARTLSARLFATKTRIWSQTATIKYGDTWRENC